MKLYINIFNNFTILFNISDNIILTEEISVLALLAINDKLINDLKQFI